MLCSTGLLRIHGLLVKVMFHEQSGRRIALVTQELLHVAVRALLLMLAHGVRAPVISQGRFEGSMRLSHLPLAVSFPIAFDFCPPRKKCDSYVQRRHTIAGRGLQRVLALELWHVRFLRRVPEWIVILKVLPVVRVLLVIGL